MNGRACVLPRPAPAGTADEEPVAAIDVSAQPEPRELTGSIDPGLLLEIGSRLQRAENLLLHPSALHAAQLIAELEECCRLLAGAQAGLNQTAPTVGRDSGRSDSSAWLASTNEWCRSLRRLELLTAGAASFCHGWAAASGLSGGYTADGSGQPAPAGGWQMDRTG